MRFASAASVAALALAGCGSSHPLGADIVHAVKAVQTIHDDERLRAELRRTRQRLARDGAKTPAERKAKALALRGVAVTLRGVEGRIAFTKNDSGNVEAAKIGRLLCPHHPL